MKTEHTGRWCEGGPRGIDPFCDAPDSLHARHYIAIDRDVVDKSPFEINTHNEEVLWEEVRNTVRDVMNTCYGTDPRHTLAAEAVANKVARGQSVPWGFARHFGRGY